MTNVIMLMWLAGFVSQLSVLFFMLGALAAVVSLGLLIDGMVESIKKEVTYGKWCAIIALVLFSISITLPNKATMNMIVAASATEAVASTELGQKGIAAMNVILDDIIKDKGK